ncbi:hypothetical protein TRIUR3_12610 [Triticum urartu]|uniref:Uncharacterized protein n=1 Tax=Triticum urartu TaxID=4572 RepID=M7YJX7_TRIUA|nr:hypothetical protein TRIUR3_12610 [Triticum urartu]
MAAREGWRGAVGACGGGQWWWRLRGAGKGARKCHSRQISRRIGVELGSASQPAWTVYQYRGVCLYPHNPALGLGVCAAIFLIIGQIIFAVVGGCCGCCKSRAIPSETNRVIGIVCAVFSWIAAVVAFGLLVEGAKWNDTGTRYSSGYGGCYVLKDGIFAGGAVLTLVATALGLTSYIMLSTQPAAPATANATAAPPKEGEQMPAAAEIPTAQPQFPQQASPQGQGYGQAPNAKLPHVPVPVASPAQGYGTPNGQLPPLPAQGYRAHAPDTQMPAASPPPAQGHGPHTPNEQALPELPPKGHEMLARPV